MQAELPKHRATLGHAASALVHVGVLALLLYRPDPQILNPSLLQKGNNGTSVSEIYLSSADLRSAIDEPSQVTPHPATLRLPRKSEKPKAPRPVTERDNLANNPEQKAGATNGTMYAGALFGHDVRPALPEVFPDPQVARDELPRGLEGDVIVEVTIDDHGRVTYTKLLQGLQPAIEARVMETVAQWRFKPATRDGVPIPSRQDVHFHFPS